MRLPTATATTPKPVITPARAATPASAAGANAPMGISRSATIDIDVSNKARACAMGKSASGLGRADRAARTKAKPTITAVITARAGKAALAIGPVAPIIANDAANVIRSRDRPATIGRTDSVLGSIDRAATISANPATTAIMIVIGPNAPAAALPAALIIANAAAKDSIRIDSEAVEARARSGSIVESMYTSADNILTAPINKPSFNTNPLSEGTFLVTATNTANIPIIALRHPVARNIASSGKNDNAIKNAESIPTAIVRTTNSALTFLARCVAAIRIANTTIKADIAITAFLRFVGGIS